MNVIFEPENVNRTDYVEKREIDNSTLYSFDAPFRLFHADVGNLEFLGKKCNFSTVCSGFGRPVFIKNLYVNEEIKEANSPKT